MPKIFLANNLNEKIYLVKDMKKNFELNYSRIKDLRVNNNLSQKDVANILNINQSTYSKFELGKATITITMLNELANYYKVSLDYILRISDINNKVKYIEIDPKVVGERLRLIRKEKHLYQETLAMDIGTSHSLISEYESGKKLISLSYAFAISRKYNISMDYLYGKID